MYIKSERGQIAIVALLGLVFVVALLMFGMAANSKGMAEGAETIGNSIASTLEGEPEIDLGTVVSAWVNNQRIYPNKHAKESHGEYEATLATNCYNDHGVFFIQANRKGDWYFHCLEEDAKTVRTTYWVKDGNRFHMQSAYTKGDGAWSWSKIRAFFENKWGATRATFPSDGVLFIDGAPAPFIP